MINGTVTTSGIVGVGSGGSAVSTTVGGDAKLLVSVSGTASDTVVSNGFISISGGVAVNTTIYGGIEYVEGEVYYVKPDYHQVETDGTAISTTLGTSSTLHVGHLAVVTGGVTFSGNYGTLSFDTSDLTTTPISGFSYTDEIDFRDLRYSPEGTVSFDDGTLTVTEGGRATASRLQELTMLRISHFFLTAPREPTSLSLRYHALRRARL